MIFDDLADQYNGPASFFTVDTDSEKELEKKYGIMELPTILFFRNGEITDHVAGLVSRNILTGKIENALIGA